MIEITLDRNRASPFTININGCIRFLTYKEILFLQEEIENVIEALKIPNYFDVLDYYNPKTSKLH